MYAGRDCQHGYAFTWQLYTRFDKVEKRTPERRKFNGEYWGSYILSQDSLLGGLYPGPQNWHGQVRYHSPHSPKLCTLSLP